MKQFCISILFVAALLAPVYTYAAESIGSIVEIEGTATKGTGNVSRPATVDDAVYMNDVIETGPGSKALIMFIDDTQITLGENAALEIDEYVYNPDNTASSTGLFSVTEGAFLFVSGLINKTQEPDVRIDTPYGSIGLRGTIVWGGQADGEYGVFVQDGAVTVRNEAGNVNLVAGEGTTLLGLRQRPEAVRVWNKDKIGRAVNTISLKNKEAIKQRVAELKQRHKARREGRMEEYRERKKQQWEDRKDTIEERRGEATDEQKERAKERVIQRKKREIKRKLNR